MLIPLHFSCAPFFSGISVNFFSILSFLNLSSFSLFSFLVMSSGAAAEGEFAPYLENFLQINHEKSTVESYQLSLIRRTYASFSGILVNFFSLLSFLNFSSFSLFSFLVTSSGAAAEGELAPYLESFLQINHEKSTVESYQFSLIRRTYEIPSQYTLRLPKEGESPNCFSTTSLCIFLDQLKFRVSFPLSEAVVSLMLETCFIPAMLAPNSLLQYLAIYDFFSRQRLTWSLAAFFFISA